MTRLFKWWTAERVTAACCVAALAFIAQCSLRLNRYELESQCWQERAIIRWDLDRCTAEREHAQEYADLFNWSLGARYCVLAPSPELAGKAVYPPNDAGLDR